MVGDAVYGSGMNVESYLDEIALAATMLVFSFLSVFTFFH